MLRVTLRSVWSHKRRLISTVLAILLGVAFMVGTFVFSDTVNQALDDLFAEANSAVDARIQGEVLLESDFGDARAPIPQTIADDVRQVDGVAGAAPYVFVEGFGPTNRVLDQEGDPVGLDAGPPTIFESWIDDGAVNGYTLTEGSRGPQAADEVALNVRAAEDAGVEVGETVRLSTQFGIAEYELVGTFLFGERETLGGLVVAAFTLEEAQRLAGVEGTVDHVVVAAEEGVTQEELVERIRAVVPADVEVLTGEEATEQDADAVKQGIGFFSQILTIFGALALLVGTFLIANTFQILVAQRTRELALLRAVGASRAQVLRSVLLEAVAVGVVAAALGILAGVLLAIGITELLDSLGVDLPTTTVKVTPGTVAAGLVVGVLVTVLAAVAPALRATRVPPLAALRDVAVERAGVSKVRLVLGGLALVVAAVDLARAWTADGDTDVLPTVGLGALALVVGVIVLGPVVAGPVVRAMGAGLPRVRGITGRLAVENAARAPKRTSATASALLIGVALIAFVAIFAASARRSVEAEVDRGVTADLVVQPSGGAFGGFGGFTPEVARILSEVEGVATVASWTGDIARITWPDGDTSDTFFGTVDPAAFGRIADVTMAEGALDDLRPGTIVVDRQIADDHDLAIGDPVSLVLISGRRLDLTVSAVSDDPAILGTITVHADDYARVVDQRLDFQVFADLEEGADLEAVKAAAAEALDEFPGLAVLDLDEWVGDLARQLSAFVNSIYGLLALSIIIAMIGVANTLSLSVHERTRELGLLRAVGMARSQLRSAIRWEAVLIALFGVVGGLGVGLLASYALVLAMEGYGLSRFAVPSGSLAVQVLVAALLAVLASLFAARRAAKLDILQAIATE